MVTERDRFPSRSNRTMPRASGSNEITRSVLSSNATRARAIRLLLLNSSPSLSCVWKPLATRSDDNRASIGRTILIHAPSDVRDRGCQLVSRLPSIRFAASNE